MHKLVTVVGYTKYTFGSFYH